MKTIAVSGYFNPIHKGHIAYLREAKNLGDKLIAIVNNDNQVKLKSSIPFMDEQERLLIVSSIRYVDEAILCFDLDETVRETLKAIKPDIFAKGGDKTADNIPEYYLCKSLGIKTVFLVGGGKEQSSSDLISRIRNLR